MAISGYFESLRQLVLPKGRLAPPAGVSQTSTFNKNNPRIALPVYRDHLDDLMQSRINDDSKTLLKNLFHHDPDVSATVNAYLTVANSTSMRMIVRDVNHEIDREGQKQLKDVLRALVDPGEYKEFRLLQTVRSISESIRYMFLLRGACCMELVLDKLRLPAEIRTIDMGKVEFLEAAPGVYKPVQVTNTGDRISLDFPTIFINYFHRDPTDVYSFSHFVSAINTIAARQTVINTLYRILNATGFPRISVKVLEEIVMKTAPAEVQADVAKRQAYFLAILNNISTTISNLRPDQAFIHSDSVEPQMLNKGKTGAEVDINSVINTLNDQNQAGLKVMSTIIGRGDSGINTSSTETRIFSLNTDELNKPVAEMWERILTLAIRLLGHEGYVECCFLPVELRTDLELEPQQVMKQQRLQIDLSLGLLTDDEYHLMMYNRLAPGGTPELSGTGFMNPAQNVSTAGTTPNTDPLGKQLAPGTSKQARGNNFKKKPGAGGAGAEGAGGAKPGP